jgi:selenophosphate synthetase-related protein
VNIIKGGLVMINIPNLLFVQYDAVLKKNQIPLSSSADYKKWLRYYLDSCSKYVVTDDKFERLNQFQEKLRTKKQSESQCRQAEHAISLYIEMQGQVIAKRIINGS